MTMTLPTTTNPDWGFFGSIAHHADPDATWPLAMTAIIDATTCDAEAVRAFLDSRHGRHFADDVANGLVTGISLQDAIDTAVRRWMGWSISRATSRATDIPRGLPYLTGFVMNAGIEAEMAAG